MGCSYSLQVKRDAKATGSSFLSQRWNNDKKKSKDSDMSRDGTATEHELLKIPDRMFVNGASDAACLFTQQGRKGTNQDAMLVWENFGSKNATIFCGVFDGHGPYGHMVAKRVRDSLPLKLCTLWKDTAGSDEHSSMTGCMDSEAAASISMEYEFCDSANFDEKEQLLELPEMYLPLKHSLLKAFKLMDKELQLHPKIDCFCSGTTAVVLLKQDQDLVIGNLGDSRAVLGTRDKGNSLISVQLTVDLKPNLPREAARIQQCKGRVFALQDEPEVPRVWLPNNDSPGLAMARAFGDFCLKDFGLISVPDISYHRLTERDEFVVVATDGVWDVLSNKEVVDIVASAPSHATAARALVECAVRAWRIRFPTSKSDDCAAVCLFVNHSPSTNNATSIVTDKPETEAEPSVTVLGKETTTGLNIGLGHGPLPQQCVLQRVDEITPFVESMEEKHPSKCQSSRSLAECISTPEEEEWSALEGITRVNSLLNLPRFLSGGDKRANSWRKWL